MRLTEIVRSQSACFISSTSAPREAHTRIVHQNIDLPEPRDCFANDGIGRIVIGDALFETGDGGVALLGFHQPFARQINRQHPCALGGEEQGRQTPVQSLKQHR